MLIEPNSSSKSPVALVLAQSLAVVTKKLKGGGGNQRGKIYIADWEKDTQSLGSMHSG